jgi:hypothetical protein
LTCPKCFLTDATKKMTSIIIKTIIIIDQYWTYVVGKNITKACNCYLFSSSVNFPLDLGGRFLAAWYSGGKTSGGCPSSWGWFWTFSSTSASEASCWSKFCPSPVFQLWTLSSSSNLCIYNGRNKTMRVIIQGRNYITINEIKCLLTL